MKLAIHVFHRFTAERLRPSQGFYSLFSRRARSRLTRIRNGTQCDPNWIFRECSSALKPIF